MRLTSSRSSYLLRKHPVYCFGKLNTFLHLVLLTPCICWLDFDSIGENNIYFLWKILPTSSSTRYCRNNIRKIFSIPWFFIYRTSICFSPPQLEPKEQMQHFLEFIFLKAWFQSCYTLLIFLK